MIIITIIMIIVQASSPDAPEESRSLIIACHLNISACCLREGNAENAVLHSTQALRMEPHNVKALFRRGSALSALGDLQVCVGVCV